MKQLKKIIVLAVLAVVMTFTVSKDANAALLNTPTNLEFNKGYSLEFHGTDYYQYNMNLTKSGKVTFNFTGTEVDSACVQIKNMSGERVWSTDIGAGLNVYSAYLLAGNYYVDVYGGWSWADFVGSFTAVFTASGETKTESYMNKNNQFGTETPYAVGQTIKAQFAHNDDTDIYKVKMPKTGYFTLRFSNEISSMNVKITSVNSTVSYEQRDIPLGVSNYKFLLPKGQYYIACTLSNDYGNYSFSSKVSDFKKVNLKKAKAQKGRMIKVTWGKRNDVDGYIVQVALNKTFKKGRKEQKCEISYWTHPNTFTFEGLKKSKKYYVRVCGYKMIGGIECRTPWSVVKTAKTTRK